MDPSACLKELLELIAQYNAMHKTKEQENALSESAFCEYWEYVCYTRDEIIERLQNLEYWLVKGGFMPTLPETVQAP